MVCTYIITGVRVVRGVLLTQSFFNKLSEKIICQQWAFRMSKFESKSTDHYATINYSEKLAKNIRGVDYNEVT